MKLFFKELFEYNHHFNQKLGDIFNNNPDKTSEKAIDPLATDFILYKK
jgi:hypothetical protein